MGILWADTGDDMILVMMAKTMLYYISIIYAEIKGLSETKICMLCCPVMCKIYYSYALKKKLKKMK